jgi:hypothetical protein
VRRIRPGFLCLRTAAAQWPQAQPQPPAREAGQADSLAQLPQPLGFATAAANEENCLLNFFAPQEGHFTGLSERVRARCSNAWPQAEQAYS